MQKRTVSLSVVCCLIPAVVCLTGAREDEAKTRFTDATMDLGIVVSDLATSLSFYTNVIGLVKTGEFSVPGTLCREAGLTDGHPLNITTLTPNGDTDGTNLKLMQIPEVDSKPPDNAFIHSQLGFSYLTFYVADIDRVLAAVKAHGAGIASRGAVSLGGGQFLSLVRDPDGNLVEIIGSRSQ